MELHDLGNPNAKPIPESTYLARRQSAIDTAAAKTH
jgi:hypothetical protein